MIIIMCLNVNFIVILFFCVDSWRFTTHEPRAFWNTGDQKDISEQVRQEQHNVSNSIFVRISWFIAWAIVLQCTYV